MSERAAARDAARDLVAGATDIRSLPDVVVRIKETTSLDPIPHLTCVCHQEDEIQSILERYAAKLAGSESNWALLADAWVLAKEEQQAKAAARKSTG